MSSRTLTDTEKRYSNIEHECLAVAYGLEKFEFYLLGRTTIIETDHSPLEQIFKKNIREAPGRLQRFLLRCLQFDVQVKYKSGKTIPVVDALSRVCFDKSQQIKDNTVHFVTDIPCPIDINAVKSASALDPTMIKLKNTIYRGWPAHRKECPPELLDYWNFRCDLVLEDGLILKSDVILIPKQLRRQVLDVIHPAHQRETKCIQLAREAVFWQGINNDIREMVKGCKTCNKHPPAQAKLPVLQPELPTRPWEKPGTDIFQFNSSKYLMIGDYFSRFPVIRLISIMTANTICRHFTQILSKHRLPSHIHADFGTQYISRGISQDVQKQRNQADFQLSISPPGAGS